MKFFRVITLCILFCGVCQLAAHAQSNKSDSSDFKPSVGLSTVYSPASFSGWGKIQNAQQFYLKAYYNHTEFSIGIAKLQWGSGIITGWMQYPRNGINGPTSSRTSLGMVPVIVTIPLFKSSYSPIISTSFGFLVTDTPFPDELGKRFNYLLDAGLGYHFALSEKYSMQAGYKLHHLSNGNASIQNPGIDSHMFFLRLLFYL